MAKPTQNELVAEVAETEAFIPYVLDDLIDMCLSDGGLSPSQHRHFREFSELFSSVINFRSHQDMGDLDKDYGLFNPDSEMISPQGSRISPVEKKEARDRVVASFREMAKNANYMHLSEMEIEASFSEQSMIKLNTDVDLDEFSKMECFVRGSDIRPHFRKNWKLKEVEEPMEVWRRVLLLMQFKHDEELSPEQLKQRKKVRIAYQPGKIYLYQFKEVPKADLEILFPNVRMSMNTKDRILLGIPAIAATIGTITKVGFKIVLIAGAIAWAFFKVEIGGFSSEQAEQPMKLAIVGMGILGALGGLFFKQYTSVKNKRIGFLKEVSEHLFFRNIAMNKAVLDRVIDDGEDEDCKEAVLVYYHLLANPDMPMDRTTLDKTIESWMVLRYKTEINFDINGPINKLKQMQGQTNSGQVKALIEEDEFGILKPLSLVEAKEVMDHAWDNAFRFSTDLDSSNKQTFSET